MKSRVGFALLLFGLVCVVVFLSWRSPATVADKSGKPITGVQTAAAPGPSAVTSFREWSAKQGSAELSPEVLEEGIRIATERKGVMLGWISDDPALALQNAVSWSEFQALPAELKPYFEQPFNDMGNLRVLPICDHHAEHDAVRTLEIGGKSWDAAVFGQRLAQGTKEDTPLAGIALDDKAAIREFTIELLAPKDAAIFGQPNAAFRNEQLDRVDPEI